MGTQEDIKKIEDEIAKTQYNKATQGHIGRLKAKLARLRAKPAAKGTGGLGYSVKKTGDATVILVGFPSVGKSTLLNSLTHADSRVAEYEFTTLTVIPGMLEYRGAKIQVLDIPGIIEEASEGKGRGKEVLAVVRNADLLLIIVSGEQYQKQSKIIEEELYQAGFRLNQRPPDVVIMKKGQGGIRIQTPRKFELSLETVKDILREYRILNGEVVIRENITIDQLIDCLEGNRKYLPALHILNKTDTGRKDRSFIGISALKKEGVESLKELIWNRLELKRIYLKKPGKEPDLSEPYIIRGPSAIQDVCERFNLQKHFKFAKIWGPSSRFPGQKVGMEHILKDQDIVEVHN